MVSLKVVRLFIFSLKFFFHVLKEFLEANGIELNEINVKKPVEPYKTKERYLKASYQLKLSLNSNVFFAYRPATTSAIRKPVRQASQIRSHAISNDGIILW